ncbi:MAG: branched-chain amino acid ABC transporter permease [Bauldia sp.]|uniref:branched-chain amino acid ABC transporter permease n=1 Tax=Bauldia sp. TaxID=2575872 RepID=UPI001D40B3D3|nr:branched-chain amino acid ABC transporter permease [Bauldia sp.]MCB1494731.1 branched-chain amino acid ABC transporter permease [Bauldia sp.]
MSAVTPDWRVERATATSRLAAVVAIVALIALAAAPAWAGRADMRLLSEIFTYLALACLWNLLAGFAGLVSVGQQAYVGFGGYMLFAFAILLGVNPLLTIPIAGILGALIAVPVAVLIFRLSGAYFAIGTWVMAEVFRLVFAQVSALGGGSGTSLPVAVVKDIAEGRDMREWIVYWAAFLLVVVVLGGTYWLLSTRRGLALAAIRDSEVASESLGVRIWRTKLMIYVVSAGATAMVGALIFLQKLRISPDAAFNVNDWTAYVIFITVIGGIGTIEGPIVGVIVFFLLRETLADLGSIYLMILGLVAIVVMLKAPRGLWGFVQDRFGIELFPVRRRIRYPLD